MGSSVKNGSAWGNRLLYWFIFLSVFATFCYFMFATPMEMDDLDFYESTREGGLASIIIRDNLRLGNMFAIILLQLPKYVSVFTQCVALAAGMLLMAKLSELDHRWTRMTLLIFLFVFAPMWENNMFITSYAFNYIVILPIFFGLIYLYLYSKKSPLWACCLLGLLLGGWHEGYALSFLGGCFLLWLFDKRLFDRRHILIACSVLVGLCYLLLSHGLWERQSSTLFNWQNCWRLVFTWLYFLYLGCWLVCLIFPGTRKTALKPLLIFAAGNCAFIPLVIYVGFERAAMPSILLCCCAMTVLTVEIARGISQKIKLTLAACAYMFVLVHLFYICREASIVYPLKKDIYAAVRENPDKSFIFHKIRYFWDAPVMTFKRPHTAIMDPFDYSMYTMKMWLDKPQSFMIVPEELKDYHSALGEPLGGNAGVYIWNGHIVSHNLNDSVYDMVSTIYRGLPKLEYSYMKSKAFPGADGREYLYIVQKHSALSTYFSEPVEFNFVK